MPQARKNSLTETLGPDLLEKIQAELESWALGYCDYTGLYKELELKDRGISFAAFYRHASYLRFLMSNQRIQEMAERVMMNVGSLTEKNRALLKGRMFVELTKEESKAKDILNLASADAALAATETRDDDRHRKQEQAVEDALKRSKDEERRDPHMALENLRNAMAEAYNITLPEKK